MCRVILAKGVCSRATLPAAATTPKAAAGATVHAAVGHTSRIASHPHAHAHASARMRATQTRTPRPHRGDSTHAGRADENADRGCTFRCSASTPPLHAHARTHTHAAHTTHHARHTCAHTHTLERFKWHLERGGRDGARKVRREGTRAHLNQSHTLLPRLINPFHMRRLAATAADAAFAATTRRRKRRP